MATPDYVLQETFEFKVSYHEKVPFAPGTFVRPISLNYVPLHVKEHDYYEPFNSKTQVFCYTPKGIFPIPRKLLRQVGGSEALDINSYR